MREFWDPVYEVKESNNKKIYQNSYNFINWSFISIHILLDYR